MALFKRMNDVIRDTSNLLIDMNGRFQTAVQDINSSSYTADRLTEDVTKTALGTFLLWLKFWRPLSDDTLPTIMITAPAASIPGATGLGGTGSLLEPIPLGTNPTVTDLAFLGWSPATTSPVPDVSTISTLAMTSPVPDGEMDALRQRITVRLNVPAAASTPQQGTYEGFVLVGSAVVAIVKARVL